jgi:hypothetical protein
VKLWARENRGPLSTWTRRGNRAIDASELEISESLRDRVQEWAADYDAAVSEWRPGPGGFASKGEAEIFAARGRQLVEELQIELGDGWHVEYMPNETAFQRPPVT